MTVPPPLRLSETRTTTANMTATSNMPPKIICQRAFTAALCPDGVDASSPGVGFGTRSLCLTRRVPQ